MALVLLDTCVWGASLPELEDRGHNVVWSGNWEKDPGDQAILESAYLEGRVLVTLDKDFGELAILKGMRHAGIIRLTGFRSVQMAGVIHHLLDAYQVDLAEGAILTVTPERVRIRRP